jgi:hypothetical protein
LVEELGEGTVQFMRMIKKAVDPLGLFNPGKVSGFQTLRLKVFLFPMITYIISVISRHIKVSKEMTPLYCVLLFVNGIIQEA